MHREAIAVWFDFYLLHTGERYVFDGKDGKHLKLLLKKIEAKVKDKGMDPTEENILNSFRGFLSTLKDTWILDNLEIAIVNSKFNSLYAKAIRNNPFTKGQQIDEIVRNKFSTDPKRAAGY
jgi:hypothetical protein